MDLSHEIKEYITLLKKMYNSGNFSMEEQDAIYDLEEGILNNYGLPNSFEISSLVQDKAFHKDDPDEAVSYLMSYLANFATKFLLTPPNTDKQILESGKLNKTPFDNILPYMKIDKHSYCIFIYEELYCKNKINVEKVIDAFQAFRDDCANEIQILICLTDDYTININFEAYKHLYQNDIPFIEEYIQNEINKRSRTPADNKDWNRLILKMKYVPETIALEHFYIVKIECYEYGGNCFLNVIYEDKYHFWKGVVIMCSRDELKIILSHSRFNENASLIRANLSENVLCLNLREFSMLHLEIVGLPFKLKKIEKESDSSDHLGFYEINWYDNSHNDEKPNTGDPELPF